MGEDADRLLPSTSTSTSTSPPVVPPYQFPYCITWTSIPVVSWLFPFIGHMGIGDSQGKVRREILGGPSIIIIDRSREPRRARSYGHLIITHQRYISRSISPPPPPSYTSMCLVQIRDFLGPMYINESGYMGFGRPLRYLRLDPSLAHGPATDMSPTSTSPNATTTTTTTTTTSTSTSTSTQAKAWDEGITRGTRCYSRQYYLFCTNNCHSYVGKCLEELQYAQTGEEGKDVGPYASLSPPFSTLSRFHMLRLATWIFLEGQYVGWQGAGLTWAPFVVALAGVIYLRWWGLLAGWLALGVLFSAGLCLYAVKYEDHNNPHHTVPASTPPRR